MDVYAYDAFCPKASIEAAGVHAVDNQNELFKNCDIVTLHIPATAETKQSINYAMVNQMKKNAILINTARKEVINEAELIKLMKEREDLKYITDIMPEADAEFKAFEGRYFSTLRRWVRRPLRLTSMPVLQLPTRLLTSSRMVLPSSR